MSKISNYKNSFEQDCVLVENEDGTSWSGLKSAYDAQVAQATLVTESAPTA